LAIYPNVLLGVHKDHTYSIILIPKGPNKTIEKVDIYYSKKITDTNLRKRNTKQWKKVFKEDISVVEGMQKGRKGIHFDGGKFSPVMDGPTHCFHKWVASNLLTIENNLHEKQ
jgi:phenylpropionate dioxygenase-like ring-hydroxylating dioxygenase large terminal subunit